MICLVGALLSGNKPRLNHSDDDDEDGGGVQAALLSPVRGGGVDRGGFRLNYDKETMLKPMDIGGDDQAQKSVLSWTHGAAFDPLCQVARLCYERN